MDPFVHDAVIDMRMARDELLRALDDVGATDWGRYVPYGGLTLHDLLAHLAGADQAWAVAAQGLLKGEAPIAAPLSPAQARSVRQRAIDRGRGQPEAALRDEMERRRRLLLGLYELLERRHLPLSLPSFGERHNSVRERIWRGYHDRLHAADVRRAMAMSWHPQRLKFLPELVDAVERLSPDGALYVIYSVDPAAWELPSRVPGWTNRALLAHIATGDWVLQLHLRSLLEHGRVSAWPDIDAGNAERLAQRQYSNVRVLVDEFLSMRHETLRLISKLKPKHLKAPIVLLWLDPPGEYDVSKYLDAFPVHEWNHCEHLRPAMKHVRARAGGDHAPVRT